MKIILEDLDDVKTLSGKFVIEETSGDNPKLKFNEDNWGFISEKRLSFISEYTFCGIYYIHKRCKGAEEFIKYFNKPSGDRYFRFLTKQELEFVKSKMFSL